MDKISEIQKHGKGFQGKRELIKHLEGRSLTMKQCIKAKCYDCMGYMIDGAVDCLIPECSLYPFMSYREGGPRKAINRNPLNPAKVERASIIGI